MTNEDLCLLIQNGENRQANLGTLYENNKGIIHSVAARYTKYEDIEDLNQEAYLALEYAATHYEKAKEATFATYLTNCLNWHIMRHLELTGSLVRVPSYKRQQLIKYRHLCAVFEKTSGDRPSADYVAWFLKITESDAQALIDLADIMTPVSLNSSVRADDTLEILDAVPAGDDLEGDVVEQVCNEELAAVLWPLVDEIDQGQANVIRKIYRDNKSHSEIADEMAVTVQKVRSDRDAALKKLRRIGRKKLKGFLEAYDIGLAQARKGNGVSAFNNSFTSSTERAAMWMLEAMERYGLSEKWLQETGLEGANKGQAISLSIKGGKGQETPLKRATEAYSSTAAP